MAKAKSGESFSAEERAAMRARAKELKANATKAEAEAAVVAAIAEMSEPDRSVATEIHAIVGSVAPNLAAKLWYGQPSWAKDGTVVLFFQSKEKFNTKFATLGFNDVAELEDGTMWATSFAITGMNAENTKAISALVARAAG